MTNKKRWNSVRYRPSSAPLIVSFICLRTASEIYKCVWEFCGGRKGPTTSWEKHKWKAFLTMKVYNCGWNNWWRCQCLRTRSRECSLKTGFVSNAFDAELVCSVHLWQQQWNSAARRWLLSWECCKLGNGTFLTGNNTSSQLKEHILVHMLYMFYHLNKIHNLHSESHLLFKKVIKMQFTSWQEEQIADSGNF